MKLIIQSALQILSDPIWALIGLFFVVTGALHITRRIINFFAARKYNIDFSQAEDWVYREEESEIVRPYWANRRDPNDPIRRG